MDRNTSKVQSLEFNEKQDGNFEITVHQKVKYLRGNTIYDGIVRRICTLRDGLPERMDIEHQ